MMFWTLTKHKHLQHESQIGNFALILKCNARNFERPCSSHVREDILFSANFGSKKIGRRIWIGTVISNENSLLITNDSLLRRNNLTNMTYAYLSWREMEGPKLILQGGCVNDDVNKA